MLQILGGAAALAAACLAVTACSGSSPSAAAPSSAVTASPAAQPSLPEASKAAWSYDPSRLVSTGDPGAALNWCQAYFQLRGGTMTVVVTRMTGAVTKATVSASLHGRGQVLRHITRFRADVGSASFRHGRAAASLAVAAYARGIPHKCKVSPWKA